MRFGKWMLVRQEDYVPKEDHQDQLIGLLKVQNQLNHLQFILDKISYCPECGEPILLFDIALHPKNDCKYQDGVIMQFDVLDAEMNARLASLAKGQPPLIEVLKKLKGRGVPSSNSE